MKQNCGLCLPLRFCSRSPGQKVPAVIVCVGGPATQLSWILQLYPRTGSDAHPAVSERQAFHALRELAASSAAKVAPFSANGALRRAGAVVRKLKLSFGRQLWPAIVPAGRHREGGRRPLPQTRRSVVRRFLRKGAGMTHSGSVMSWCETGSARLLIFVIDGVVPAEWFVLNPPFAGGGGGHQTPFITLLRFGPAQPPKLSLPTC